MDPKRKQELTRDLELYLGRTTYPLSKAELFEFVRAIARGNDLVDLIQDIPDKEYKNPQEILDALE